MFPLLTIINNATMNIYVQFFVKLYVFSSIGYIPMSGITESYGNSMFNILRNHQTVSTAAAPFYIPRAMYGGCNFSPILIIIIIILVIAILLGMK